MDEQAATMSATRKTPGFLILAAGIVTTAIALALVLGIDFLAEGGFSLMGFYVCYVVPISAIAVGAVAASGYVLMSWLQGVRVNGGLLVTVTVLMVGAYFTAQYLEYDIIDPRYEDGTKIDFVTFFDETTRAIAFTSRGKEGSPLGTLGYGVRLLEVVGFCLGGFLAMRWLGAKPFCEACQVYMKSAVLCLIPASPPKRKVSKKDIEGMAQLTRDQETAARKADEAIAELRDSAEKCDAPRFAAAVATHAVNPKEAAKLDQRVEVSLARCPRCSNGHVKLVQVSGQGDKTKRTELGTFPAASAFVQGYLTSGSPEPVASGQA